MMMNNLYSNRIKELQLQILRNQFELISKNTILQLTILKQLFDEPKTQALYEEALSNEIIIDRLEVKIREEVAFSIFKFSPVAEDLRRIIAYQDLTTNLERIGDMTLNIIRFVRELPMSDTRLYEVRGLIIQMTDHVTQMVRNAVMSFTNESYETAVEVIGSDEVMDEMYHSLRALLCKLFSHVELQENDVQVLLNLEGVGHNLERCGDSATNIAESTIYLVKGSDIRHVNDGES
ncbi:phosphate signaling complex PhoU family protein [Porphyromonas somerae]|uniref:phosphate signaling complex PhoU family protein n=1 Tax=Porphyromonas somerae TaxID=322095 RepID=UPI0003775542|nr:PhoU domain-containing protein [Porphyromonas somerae]BDE82015.1 phosphate transport system regulatory protein PhoU [Porphyromonas somerae]